MRDRKEATTIVSLFLAISRIDNQIVDGNPSAYEIFACLRKSTVVSIFEKMTDMFLRPYYWGVWLFFC